MTVRSKASPLMQADARFRNFNYVQFAHFAFKDGEIDDKPVVNIAW